MTIATVPCYDATGANVPHLPPGQHAGYTTGSGGIAWTAAQWSRDPGAVRIDQSWNARDPSADVLDVETGAATPAEVPRWCEAAAASFASGRRPGQRSPAVYLNLSNLTAAVNALVSAGITSGVSLWVANWNLSASAAAALVQNAAGPFPVIGVQYRNAGLYDVSVFSAAWLADRSGGGIPAAGDPVLSAPASGPAVARLQDRLNAWGASPRLTPDGSFGPATTAALRAFQAARGLTPDGICGPASWKLLNGTPPAPGWAYPAPASAAAAVSRSVTVSWAAVVPPAGHPAPADYTVQLLLAGAVVRTQAAAGLSVTLTGLAAGSYEVRVWADGGVLPPAHATASFTA